MMNEFEQAVKNYVDKTFKTPYFRTEPCEVLPHGIRVIDTKNEEALVYWNHFKNGIDVVFPNDK